MSLSINSNSPLFPSEIVSLVIAHLEPEEGRSVIELLTSTEEAKKMALSTANNAVNEYVEEQKKLKDIASRIIRTPEGLIFT